MADRGYLHRLRTTGGPSYDLLVLLDRHRVMTTDQLGRATGTPERSVRYRLERLHSHGLIDCVRPGRERGSAPRHWWLRPSGARLVAGTAAAEGRPSGMFVAHAAAITEVWLAFVEHGPAKGIGVREWLTDRAGWQEWQRSSRWSSHPSRLTPDALATVALPDGGEAVVFVEVDLASMTQTVLKQKVARYLAYADDLVWQDRYPSCPPMLLFTTTATRAVSFSRVAGQVLATRRADDNDPAAALVVAACGHVRDPATAVLEPCWIVPSAAGGELTLAEILAERRRAASVSEAWLYERDVVQRRRDDIEELRSIARSDVVTDWLGSARAAAVLQALIGANPSRFLDDEPDLAAQVLEWFDRRRRTDRFKARDLAEPFVSILESRHGDVWRGQALRLLVAEGHIAAAHPRLHRLAARLASGDLATAQEAAILDQPPSRTWADIQHGLLAAYPTRRAAAVDERWAELRPRERRRVTREQLDGEYDERNLCICGTCALVYPLPPDGATVPSLCPHCDGIILDWPEHTTVTTFAEHLNAIRASTTKSESDKRD